MSPPASMLHPLPPLSLRLPSHLCHCRLGLWLTRWLIVISHLSLITTISRLSSSFVFLPKYGKYNTTRKISTVIGVISDHNLMWVNAIALCNYCISWVLHVTPAYHCCCCCHCFGLLFNSSYSMTFVCLERWRSKKISLDLQKTNLEMCRV